MDTPIITKTCSTCKETKQVSYFGILSSSKDGHNHRCRLCMRAANKKYSLTHPDQYHSKKRESWLRSNYGITIGEYNEMVLLQGDTCAICQSADKGTNRGYWCVDHDHLTGKVRGLLCAPCNKSLGQFRDSISVLERALDYLKSHKPIDNC